MVNWKHAKSWLNVSNELICRKCKIFRLNGPTGWDCSIIRWHWNNQRPSGCSLNDRRNVIFFFISNTMRIKVCVQLSEKNDLAFGWTFRDRLDAWKYSIKYFIFSFYFQHLIWWKCKTGNIPNPLTVDDAVVTLFHSSFIDSFDLIDSKIALICWFWLSFACNDVVADGLIKKQIKCAICDLWGTGWVRTINF